MSQEFLILPAIDLLDGRSVRLSQGRRESASEVHPDPFRQFEEYRAAGAKWVHLVNLNAAFGDSPDSDGRMRSQELIERLIEKDSLKIEIGGGIRSAQDVKDLLRVGISRIVIGTWATHSPDECMALAEEYPENIVVGLDTKGDSVATHGWTHASGLNVFDFGRRLQTGGLRYALYTQVERDGLLTGIDDEAAAHLYQKTGLKVIASGGVKDIGDIERLSKTAGVAGVVIGKALAAGTLKLEDALRFQRL